MDLGINLSFAVKRWPEPEAWARLVREDLGLTSVQFTFDLLDPWWPEATRRELAGRVRRAAQDWGIEIQSAFVGLAAYTYNGLLHPDAAGREAALAWWQRAIDVAAAIGASAVGGPLGGMTARDASDADARARQEERLLDGVRTLVEATTAAGLGAFLIEPTPLPREVPHTPEQAVRLLAELGEAAAARTQYALDVGHAGYRPLYGPDAAAERWLDALGERIGLVHLQNHDYQSDSHWGWPDGRGRFEISPFARALRERGLGNVPVFLELFYPFEQDDGAVLANVRSSVRHARAELGARTLPSGHRAAVGP